MIILKYLFEAQILIIHNLKTNLNYLSSKALLLYCVFDIQKLVLCFTRELVKFFYYKLRLKYSVELHLIFPVLVKIAAKSNKN